jgi:hypothetical protein
MLKANKFLFAVNFERQKGLVEPIRWNFVINVKKLIAECVHATLIIVGFVDMENFLSRH